MDQEARSISQAPPFAPVLVADSRQQPPNNFTGGNPSPYVMLLLGLISFKTMSMSCSSFLQGSCLLVSFPQRKPTRTLERRTLQRGGCCWCCEQRAKIANVTPTSWSTRTCNTCWTLCHAAYALPSSQKTTEARDTVLPRCRSNQLFRCLATGHRISLSLRVAGRSLLQTTQPRASTPSNNTTGNLLR